MKKDWFVLQTLTGQEQKVSNFIEAEKRLQGLEEYVGETLIPTEKVVSVKSGRKTTLVKKLFPGYVFIEVALYDEQREIIERVWSFIKGIQGVIGFLGSDRPMPMSERELDEIRGVATDPESKPIPKILFNPGEMVKVIDGPFTSFSGIVEEVDPERGKLKVSVTIFGRTAPVELDYWQVERDDEPVPATPQ